MEFLNKVQLRGVVGRAEISTYGDKRLCSFSLVTEYLNKHQDGTAEVEVTWFNCRVWENSNDLPDADHMLESIEKGAKLELTGRFRARRYTTESGEERTSYDILVKDWKLIEAPAQQ